MKTRYLLPALLASGCAAPELPDGYFHTDQPLVVPVPRITEYALEKIYPVDVRGDVPEEVLGLIESVMSKTEARYPGALEKLQIALSVVPQEQIEPPSLAYSQTHESDLDPEFRQILADAGVGSVEVERIRRYGRLQPRDREIEESMPANVRARYDAFESSGKSHIIYRENSLIAIPDSIDEEWVLAHELGHILIGRDMGLFEALREGFSKAAPYRLEEIVGQFPDPATSPDLFIAALNAFGNIAEKSETEFDYVPDGLVNSRINGIRAVIAVRHVASRLLAGLDRDAIDDVQFILESLPYKAYHGFGSLFSEDAADIVAGALLGNLRDNPLVREKADMADRMIREAWCN